MQQMQCFLVLDQIPVTVSQLHEVKHEISLPTNSMEASDKKPNVSFKPSSYIRAIESFFCDFKFILATLNSPKTNKTSFVSNVAFMNLCMLGGLILRSSSSSTIICCFETQPLLKY